MLTYERAVELFQYNPNTGLMVRRMNGWLRPTGTLRADGYFVVRADYKLYLLHRVAWLLTYGEWPDTIDHIDRDPSNNKLDNLRSVDRTINGINRAPPSNNTSGFVGVAFRSDFGKWVAQFNGCYLGSYSTKEEAIAARKVYLEAKYGIS